MPRPFQQLPFSALPQQPRVPHPYFDCPSDEVVVQCAMGAVRTHFRVYGSGPALLLVHGLMTSSYSWRYLLEPLGEHFTLYIPDLPGSGRSDKPDTSYAPAAYTSFLSGFVARLGLRGCSVIGNSMGGYLCMQLALREPGSIGRLVNLHSPGVPLKRLYLLHTVLGLPGSLSLLRWLVAVHPELWIHKNVHYYDETLKSREETKEYAASLLSEGGATAFGRILKETFCPSTMAAFVRDLERREAFPVPLLMVYARQDPMVPAKVGEQLQALLPTAEWAWLDQASHFAHVDHPLGFLEASLPFLLGSDRP